MAHAGVAPADTVFMVSGYMRTGTSMMMRALEAGGLTAAYRESRDLFRKSYADDLYDPNAGGLYELEVADYRALDFPVKYRGQLVKCLLAGKVHLAVVPRLKVVFMRRDFEEIRQSYQAFFDRDLPAKAELVLQTIEDAVAQLHNRRDCDVNVFWYRDVLRQPAAHFTLLHESGWPIDVAKAAAIVDEKQCRFRRESLIEGIR